MDLVLYRDKGLKEPFTIEDLGDVDAGDIRILDGYLKNESMYNILDIESELFDEDVELIDVPNNLESENWQLVKIKYAPKETRTTALNTFITFHGKKRIPPE